jgi:hypothetical protein
VRKRIARGTLQSTKGEEGSVWVWLDYVDDRRHGVQSGDWTETGQRLGDRLDELIEAKDEALRDLRDQLEHMRRESERKDAIIMQMAQANAALAARVPELEPIREASPEPRDVRETASEEPGGVEVGEKQEKQRPWLHRFLFGPRA